MQLIIFAHMYKTIRFLVSFLIITGLFSCRHVKDVAYFQEGKKDDNKVVYPNFNQNKPKVTPYEAIIQSNDILSIYVSSLSKEASAFFNETQVETASDSRYSTQTAAGYLVDASGNIELPLIGKVKVAGLTTQIARDTLVKRLEIFLQNPSVKIYFANFRVTILGEVVRPGVYNVTNEKLSLTEAIGLAGDLTIFGNRKKIMLIREIEGEKKFFNLDITSRDMLNSPYYFLHSNDVLYVEPTSGKVSLSDNFYRVVPMAISLITLAIVLVTTINNQK